MEGEQKLCLAEPTLEIGEETPPQVQTQLLEEMQDLEALAAEVEVEALVEGVILLNQEEMEVTVELVVMEAAVEREVLEGMMLVPLQEQEVQEVLAALEEEVEAAVVLGLLWAILEEEIMVVMVQQEAMAEEEVGEEVIVEAQVLVAAALVALD